MQQEFASLVRLLTPRSALLGAGLLAAFGLSVGAQAPQTFTACYVPAVGAIYIIKLPGLPQSCLAPAHKEISWQEGATGPASGDLSGTFPNPNVIGLRGRAMSATAPAVGQTLVFDGVSWVPGTPQANAGGTAGGDLTGVFPNPNVVGLRGRLLSATSPVAGQTLMFDGSAWVPTTPQVGAGGAAGGDLTGTYPNPAVAKLRGTSVAVTAPVDGQALIYDSGTNSWRPATLPSGVSDHGQLSGLGDDDHPQYLLANGARALLGALNAGGNKITGLAAATAAGDAVRFQQAVKSGDAAGGDLGGTFPSPSVVRLQGNAVSATTPTNGQSLVWNGIAWAPATSGAPVVGGDLSGPLSSSTVTGLQGRAVLTTAPLGGQVLGWNGTAWAPAGVPVPTPGGDLSGTIAVATVVALQNRPVSVAAPTGGDVLTWNGSAWTAAATRAPTITAVTDTTNLTANAYVTVTVLCPPGTYAISHGWKDFTVDLFLTVLRRLDDGSGWEFSWKSHVNGPMRAISTVYCAR